MKGSNGIRFATALIVVLISLFGFGSSLFILNCDRIHSEYVKLGLEKDSIEHNIAAKEGRIKSPSLLPINYQAEYEQKKREYNNKQDEFQKCHSSSGLYKIAFPSQLQATGTNILLGTIVIDGIVLGVYQFFGKSKEKTTEKEASKKD